MTATFPLILALVSGLPQSDTPPQSDTIPPDSYEDRHVRELVARAREARRTMRAGLESYEGVLRERTYMGLSGSRFRRERALFQEDRVGRIRWEVTGDNAVHWRGARWKVPIFGETEAQEEFTESMSSSLARGVTPMPLSFDPGDDRLVFGSGDALNPLADSAALHYRYYSGDTLRVRLPTGDREIVMAEVRVEPRRSSFDLLSGSLWFDVETAVLVRAAYRPARPFDFDLDAPEDAGYVPGFFKPITVEIKYVTVEYALQEFQWWLPRRYALRGEAKVASLFRTPVTVEWSVSRYEVNESEGLLAEALSGRLPPGWSRTDREVASRPGQPPRYITVLIPPIDSLINSPELPPEDLGPEPVAFSDQELDKLRAELEALLPRPPGVPRLAYGLREGLMRYNRIEGLSVGVRGSLSLPLRTSLTATARAETAALGLAGELSLGRGPEERRGGVAVYRRLLGTSDWENPFSLSSSLDNLLFGRDPHQYYRTRGVEGAVEWRGRRTHRRIRLFYEKQSAANKETDFYLLGLLRDDTLSGNIAAREGTVGGVSAEVRWHLGVDPSGTGLSGRFHGEAVVGDFRYQRLWGSTALHTPLPFNLAGALEVVAGSGWGDLPLQRNFYLGGPRTLRGFRRSSRWGEAFWLLRGELGNDFPAVRTVVFADLGWTGTRDAFPGSSENFLASAGLGFSLLDGIIRFDLAKGIRGASATRGYLYLDGLF